MFSRGLVDAEHPQPLPLAAVGRRPLTSTTSSTASTAVTGQSNHLQQTCQRNENANCKPGHFTTAKSQDPAFLPQIAILRLSGVLFQFNATRQPICCIRNGFAFGEGKLSSPCCRWTRL